jgi:CRP-like cAMP-binding protein
MKTIRDIIAGQSFFKDLTEEQLTALADAARYRRLRNHELLFHHGNLANRFYVVIEGKVALEAPAQDGHPVHFQTAGPGDLLGWSWMFSNAFQQLQARALEPTEVIYFCGDGLRQQCDQDHSLGYQLFQRVAEIMMQRLQATRQMLLGNPCLAFSAEPNKQPAQS